MTLNQIYFQKLAAMAHGVGKEDPDSATSASSAEALYQGKNAGRGFRALGI